MNNFFRTIFRAGQPSPSRDPEKTLDYVIDVERRVRRAMESADNYLDLATLTVEPDFKVEGMVVRADGTTWNPGSGAGLYEWVSATSTWNPIGTGSISSTLAYAARHG